VLLDLDKTTVEHGPQIAVSNSNCLRGSTMLLSEPHCTQLPGTEGTSARAVTLRRTAGVVLQCLASLDKMHQVWYVSCLCPVCRGQV
jgi:hypothetical protein